MNTMTQMAGNPSVPDGAPLLLLPEGAAGVMAEDPEWVIEQIQLRATQMSSVLESILQEPHDLPHWEVKK